MHYEFLSDLTHAINELAVANAAAGPSINGFLSDLVRQCSEYDAHERCTFAHVVEQLSAPALRAEATRLPPGPAFLGGAVDAASLPAPPRAPVAKIHSSAARLPSSSALHAAADGQDERSRRRQSALFGFHSDSAPVKEGAGRQTGTNRRGKSQSQGGEPSASSAAAGPPPAPGRLPAAGALPAISFASKLCAHSRRSKSAQTPDTATEVRI